MDSKTIIGIACTCLMLAGCKGEAPKLPLLNKSVAATEVEVRVMDCSESQSHSTSCYVGTVQPSKQTVLTAQYPGVLESISVHEGQKVRKGDEIARLSSTSVQSSYDMAKATLDYAEDGYARAAQLHETGSISDSKMAEIESKLQQARASEKAAAKALEDLVIKAPYDATVGAIYPSVGEQVTIAGRVAQLYDVKSVEVHFNVPENDYSNVSVGQKARISVPATGKEFAGKVGVKGVVASQLSHNYECIVENVPETTGSVPGMVCKVYLEKKSDGGIVIPSSSVMTDNAGRYVWIVVDGKAERRYVTVGGYSGKGIVVESGLGPDDKVIVDGGRKVSTGVKVKTICR